MSNAVVMNSTLFCPKCKYPLSSKWNYCPKCGTELEFHYFVPMFDVGPTLHDQMLEELKKVIIMEERV